MPTATPTPTATSQPIDELQNGDFERGRNGAWTEVSEKGYVIITEQRPSGLSAHSGTWISWLGGTYDEARAIRQQVTIPPNRPYLQYWHWIASADICGYDVAGVILDDGDDEDDIVDSFWLCDSADTNGWRMRVLDLRAYAGQSVKLVFLTGTDGTLNSNWFVDDVVFVSSPGRGRGQEVDGEAAARLGAALSRLPGQAD